MSKRVIVIMAGGSGERFWPWSRKKNPKQLLALAGERSMLEDTVERASLAVPRENVFIVAGPHLMPRIRETLGSLPAGNFITEPAPKNTAPCLALSAAVVGGKMGENAVMGVLSADSLIRNTEVFVKNVDLAFEFAEQNAALVTMGIIPRHPDTGFGYLELGEPLRADERGKVHRVVSFREKPDAANAEEFVKSGMFLWNSGMFFWKVRNFLAALDSAAPEFAEGTRRLEKAAREGAGFERTLTEVFENWPAISIDYALMERAPSVAAVAGAFDWDDVGTWASLLRTQPRDENGNVLRGDVAALETENCVLYNLAQGEGNGRILAGLGIRDLVVVATDDAVLVCPASRAQDIKKVLQKLRSENREKHL